MNAVKEIERREKCIKDRENTILELREEITALYQLLDCAAANIVLLVGKCGGIQKLSKKEVSDVLGKYKLTAKRDDDGNYVLETVSS